MSIFSDILSKLGIKKPAVQPVKPKFDSGGQIRSAAQVGKPAAMPMVDIVSKLDGLAKKSPIELNWRVSINDLMALLGMDHKSEDIKQLAVELHCPESEMGDSYKRNVWTHKELLKQIAANGGNVPANLLRLIHTSGMNNKNAFHLGRHFCITG